MSKHKYSSYFLLLIVFIIGITTVITAFGSSDLDSVCNVDNSTLKRVSGFWGCHIEQESTPVTTKKNYNLPMIMKPANNEYVGNLLTGTLTTQANAAGRVDISPFIPTYNFSVDQLGVSISTAVASSKIRVVVFASDSLGRPTTQLLTSAEIDSGTLGTRFAAVNFNFTENTIYWLGTWSSSTATLRSGQTYNSAPLTWTNAATPAREHVLRRVEAYNSVNNASDWSYAAAQHTGANAYLILMRVSA